MNFSACWPAGLAPVHGAVAASAGVLLTRPDRSRAMALSLSSVEWWQLIYRQHHANRTRLADSSRDQPAPIKGQNHLMDGWWRHLEVTLDIRLRRWAAIQFRVHSDER